MDVSMQRTISFQSTLPHGERRTFCYGLHDNSLISIHAPARGATKKLGLLGRLWKFQSTLPHGERLGLAPARASCLHFNPRSRTGSDIVLWGDCGQHFDFNPRSRTGSDYWPGVHVVGCTISIHAPARGATTLIFAGSLLLCQFQSTLPHGERQQIWTNLICKICRNLV